MKLVSKANGKKFYTKVPKSKLTSKQKEQRTRAYETQQVLLKCEDRFTQVGEAAMVASGVELSQVSAFVAGTAKDDDGDIMQVEQELQKFRRMNCLDESDDEE